MMKDLHTIVTEYSSLEEYEPICKAFNVIPNYKKYANDAKITWTELFTAKYMEPEIVREFAKLITIVPTYEELHKLFYCARNMIPTVKNNMLTFLDILSEPPFYINFSSGFENVDDVENVENIIEPLILFFIRKQFEEIKLVFNKKNVNMMPLAKLFRLIVNNLEYEENQEIIGFVVRHDVEISYEIILIWALMLNDSYLLRLAKFIPEKREELHDKVNNKIILPGEVDNKIYMHSLIDEE